MKTACEHHKRKELGYIEWHKWADVQIKKKLKQVKCKECGLYFFPEELNEPENEKANEIIRKSEEYLALKAEKKHLQQTKIK